MTDALRIALIAAAILFAPLDRSAAADAEALYRELADKPFISGRFTQARELADVPATIRSQGRFMIWRDHGLYWETTQPLFHATTFTTEQTYEWNEPGSAEAVEPGAFDINRRISSIILALFEADFQRLEEDFSVSIDDTGKRWTVTLTPSNRFIGKALERIVVGGASDIETVRLQSASGDTTRITLEVTGGGDAPAESERARLSPADIETCCLPRP